MNERFLAYLISWAVDRIGTAIMNAEPDRQNWVELATYEELNEQADVLMEEYKPNGK